MILAWNLLDPLAIFPHGTSAKLSEEFTSGSNNSNVHKHAGSDLVDIVVTSSKKKRRHRPRDSL